eukprot:766046-Hanusia_phi.AAC.2
MSLSMCSPILSSVPPSIAPRIHVAAILRLRSFFLCSSSFSRLWFLFSSLPAVFLLLVHALLLTPLQLSGFHRAHASGSVFNPAGDRGNRRSHNF